ncbi:hypothetical protein VTN00DRAFT_67 [Thermoascus crustaceus]|uniref:uncharacterized protein n=1 Tax=Thermoascus crustaceus TaxID=5088 RepID=UPI00374465AA
MALIRGALLLFFLHFLVSALAGIIPNFNQITPEDTILDINEAILPGILGDAQYDAIIVGGGPAGLSALSGLARVERTALLFDSGDYRNGPTRNLHDVIGNDGSVPGSSASPIAFSNSVPGTVPSVFRATARKQILEYYSKTAEIRYSTVVSIMKADNGAYFSVSDNLGKTFTAKKIILGTGMRDILPTTPGIEDAWGQGMFWCTWCDGFEHRDQPMGVLGPLRDVLDGVNVLRTLNQDVIAFTNGTWTPDEEAAALKENPKFFQHLEAYNVVIDNRSIVAIERLADGSMLYSPKEHKQFDRFRVHFAEGPIIERNAFITNFPVEQRSSLPAQMGLKMKGNKIETDINDMRTSLKGVWAAGDANSDGSTNVPHAMFSGKRAAVSLHMELAREESQASILKRGLQHSKRESKRQTMKRIGNELEELWDRTQVR